MDHLLYSAEDFVRDESYLRYYFRLDREDTAYWQDWISRHPEKLDVIVSADQLIALLSLSLPEDEFQVEFERILKAIRADTPAGPLYAASSTGAHMPGFFPRRESSLKNNKAAWTAAAILACLIAGVGGYWGWISHGNSRAGGDRMAGMDLKINDTRRSVEFELEEGTLITLEPGARLSFPHHFLSNKREVNLEGDAFFKVSKSPSRPFYIYCNNLVTHVLGTSFSIKTDKNNRKTEVSVRTGKVEVYEEHTVAATAGSTQKKENGVILTPNQKVIYEEERRQFEVTLADIPLPLPEEAATEPAARDADAMGNGQNTVYQAIPLSSLIGTIKKSYGIEVEVENENLYNCHFSGDISDMNLFEKLDAVCKSINAKYEIKGTEILIRGEGCKPSGE